MDFSAAVEAIYRLNTGVIGTETGRHERPHKPVLLLAVFDALASRKAQPNRVEWSAWLRERFRIYFEQVRSHADSCTPEFPFYHLKGDGFWLPVSVESTGEIMLAAPPKARDLDTGRVFVSGSSMAGACLSPIRFSERGFAMHSFPGIFRMPGHS